jgi:2-oxoglutarate dehydrogenase E2 component (dihydrolipoamide succinyltransferase)
VEEKAAERPKVSPAVRNLLSENDLEAGDVPDSDADGRITKEDVINYLDKQEKPAAAAPATPAISPPRAETPKPQPATQAKPEKKTEAPESKPAPAPATGTESRPQERVPMTRLRQRTAERLLLAQHENAILTTFNEVNMKPVMELRARFKDQFEKEHGVKLGFMSFFTKASTEALKKFPVINASIDGKDIVYQGFFDIGIAVSAPRGLVVPVIRDADTLSFAEIEAKIVEYGQKAKDSKLTMDELTGGTFTITNGGIFGSLLSTPILNPPQSAILGMHKIQERPMAVNGEVVILPMMYLALSYDHRIVDGRDAVQFLVAIKELLEDPSRLLLQV